MRRSILAIPFLSIWALAALADSPVKPDNAVQVPFVGCPADGQTGPLPAPTGHPKTLHVSSALPGPIAFYSGEDGMGVYAPAGWHCLETYGSAGEDTIVSAHVLPKSGVPQGTIDAPVIVISGIIGETSGRFEVARLGWMLFPDITKDFAKGVEDEGIVSKADIEVPKYPKDDLTYLSKTLVRFETPANTKGVGAEGYVGIAKGPIIGLVKLDGFDGDDDDGLGISILRISMGTKDETWARLLLQLNTPCLTGKSCQQ